MGSVVYVGHGKFKGDVPASRYWVIKANRRFSNDPRCRVCSRYILDANMKRAAGSD